jgi:hypothetical protein
MNSITINGITIELQKECPDCEGKSAYANMTCDKCGNTGVVERYWTPGEAEEAGLKMLDSDPVWMFNRRTVEWVNLRLVDANFAYSNLISWIGQTIFIDFPFQPAPPKDYKP